MGKLIGIFGGTFDPIHTGHAIVAQYVATHCGLDQLWLMVTPENPFKQGRRPAAEVHRLRMAEMVSRRLEGVTTSAFEMQLPRPSYTIDTIEALEQRLPGNEFVLVIGADNWASWRCWYRCDDLLKKCCVLVYPRFGYEVDVPPELSGRVEVVDAPVMEISSTMIRHMLATDGKAPFYLPADVEQYAIEHQLYTQIDENGE